MMLIEVLPKDDRGRIILSPGGSYEEQENEGFVDTEWFQTNFIALASSNVPLSDADFTSFKAIDQYWSMNADRWRTQGLI